MATRSKSRRNTYRKKRRTLKRKSRRFFRRKSVKQRGGGFQPDTGVFEESVVSYYDQSDDGFSSAGQLVPYSKSKELRDQADL